MLFHRSLKPTGTMTSLNNGLPSRETCTHGPAPCDLPLARIVALCREAVVQIPITDFGLAASVGLEPSLVSSFFGTWMAMLWTLKPVVPSIPAAAAVGIRCKF